MVEYNGQASQDYFVEHILKKKKNGYFLEIGSSHAKMYNNTYLLEKSYGWTGIMVEYYPFFMNEYNAMRQNSIAIIKDAREVDYLEELQKANYPKHMDYLQIDLDVDNRSTLDVLEKINNTVFNDYKFATVTFEHDIYRGDYFNTRDISRNIFESRGYVRIFSDIMLTLDGADVAFEDWYVHPDLVDMNFVNKVKHDGPIHCHETMKRLEHAYHEIIHAKEYKLSLSEGEILDRLSILEIKQSQIHNKEQLLEISKELKLYDSFSVLKHAHIIYYKLLLFINKRIWDLTNEIKAMTYDHPTFANISFLIFEYNQQRFRLKNIINQIANSTVKEQKSYAKKIGYVSVITENNDSLYTIIYNLLHNDNVELYCDPSISLRYKQTIQSLFPTVTFIEIEKTQSEIDDKNHEVQLYTEYFNKELQQYLEPIYYIAGGKLGDFILQLSVINEMYQNSGRKGILYIYDKIPNLRFDASFGTGLFTTYYDVYSLVIKQPYILDFKIYNQQHYDINLSSWYNNPSLFQTNWHHIFRNEYNIDWGKHKWIYTDGTNKYIDSIVITPFPRNITVNLQDFLMNYDRSKIVFVCFHEDQYKHFVDTYGLELPFILCKTIEDMAIIIDNCHLYIGCMSSPLTLAQATHHPTMALLDFSLDATHNLLNDVLPNYTCVR